MIESGHSLTTLLNRWVDAELLSQEQSQAIAYFEKNRGPHKDSRPSKAIALLGALTLTSGVGSLVAYNWGRFGDGVKLTAMGGLLAIACALLLHSQLRSPHSKTRFDVLALIVSGLSLGSLALISQVYAQEGELWQLLVFWCLLTAPLLAHTSSRFLQYYWFFGLWVSLVSATEDLTEVIELANSLRPTSGFTTALIEWTVGLGVSFLFARSKEPLRARVGKSLYTLHIIALGLVGSFTWLHSQPGVPILWLAGVAIATLVWLTTPLDADTLGWGTKNQVRQLILLGLFGALLPLGLSIDSRVGAFVSYGAFWSFAWFLSEKSQHQGLARLSVAALGLRILVASFELFDSLMITGCVLMGLGATVLFMVRKNWNSSLEEDGAS